MNVLLHIELLAFGEGGQDTEMEKDAGYPTSHDAQVANGSVLSPQGGKGRLWSRIKHRATLEVEPSTYAPPGTSWSNKDLDPVPLERQTWRTVRRYMQFDSPLICIFTLRFPMGETLTCYRSTTSSRIGSRMPSPYPTGASARLSSRLDSLGNWLLWRSSLATLSRRLWLPITVSLVSQAYI